MPLIIDNGPLQDGHPFKGTQIFFGIRPTKSSEKSSPKEEPPAKNGVFMMRGEGQSWEEFKKACIVSLKNAGLIKPE